MQEPLIEHRPDRKALAVVFACGALTGIALALMLAPASGDDTRRQLRGHATAARERTARLVHDRNVQAHAFLRRHGIVGLLHRRNGTPPAA